MESIRFVLKRRTESWWVRFFEISFAKFLVIIVIIIINDSSLSFFYHYHHCHHYHCHFEGKCECLSAFIVKSDRTCVDRTVRWRDQYGGDTVDMMILMIITTNVRLFDHFHWQGWGATKSWSWGRRVQWCGQWPFHPHFCVIIVILISSL